MDGQRHSERGTADGVRGEMDLAAHGASLALSLSTVTRRWTPAVPSLFPRSRLLSAYERLGWLNSSPVSSSLIESVGDDYEKECVAELDGKGAKDVSLPMLAGHAAQATRRPGRRGGSDMRAVCRERPPASPTGTD